MVKINPKSVIFSLDVEAQEVYIKGSWNNWEPEPMKKNKSGIFKKTKRLKPGRYLFGYEVDGRWLADESTPQEDSPFGSKNSVLEIG